MQRYAVVVVGLLEAAGHLELLFLRYALQDRHHVVVELGAAHVAALFHQRTDVIAGRDLLARLLFLGPLVLARQELQPRGRGIEIGVEDRASLTAVLAAEVVVEFRDHLVVVFPDASVFVLAVLVDADVVVGCRVLAAHRDPTQFGALLQAVAVAQVGVEPRVDDLLAEVRELLHLRLVLGIKLLRLGPVLALDQYALCVLVVLDDHLLRNRATRRAVVLRRLAPERRQQRFHRQFQRPLGLDHLDQRAGQCVDAGQVSTLHELRLPVVDLPVDLHQRAVRGQVQVFPGLGVGRLRQGLGDLPGGFDRRRPLLFDRVGSALHGAQDKDIQQVLDPVKLLLQLVLVGSGRRLGDALFELIDLRLGVARQVQDIGGPVLRAIHLLGQPELARRQLFLQFACRAGVLLADFARPGQPGQLLGLEQRLHRVREADALAHLPDDERGAGLVDLGAARDRAHAIDHLVGGVHDDVFFAGLAAGGQRQRVIRPGIEQALVLDLHRFALALDGRAAHQALRQFLGQQRGVHRARNVVLDQGVFVRDLVPRVGGHAADARIALARALA